MALNDPAGANRDNRKWTVMVFMGADTIEGNAPLDHAVDADLNEIGAVGGAPTLEILVEVHHSAKPTRQIHFGVDGAVTENEVPAFRGEPALLKFIEGSIKAAAHRPQDNSMLVLWGHAYDFAFARGRMRSGEVDSIDFITLSTMLHDLQDRMRAWYKERQEDNSEGPPTLDILAFDACDISTVEMACQLQPFVKYLLGSEIGVPMPGWPYDRVLDRLKHPVGRLMAPAEFGSYVIRRFCESYKPSRPVSLTLLDLRKAGELRNYAENLADALSARIDDARFRAQVMEVFTRSQTGAGRPYVDVADLCLSLRRELADRSVMTAATALGDFLFSPGLHVVGNSVDGKGRPFIVDHGRNAGELARLNGISLYAPHVASRDFEAVRGIYDQFVFAKNTMWSKLVHLLATLS